jgi:hypothetical protein
MSGRYRIESLSYFTVEDIHKIREWNYERLKDTTPEEWQADTTRREEAGKKRQ